MAVKGRQAKLKDPHDTTRVVDVSCASISSIQSSSLVRQNTTKNVNGRTDDYQRRRQDLVREHETTHRLRRPRPMADLREANPAMAPKLFL